MELSPADFEYQAEIVQDELDRLLALEDHPSGGKAQPVGCIVSPPLTWFEGEIDD